MPAALFGGGIQYIGVPRIHHDVVHPGIFADLEDLFPGLSAIGGFVKSAVTAGSPYRTFGGHDKQHPELRGIDSDLADLAGILESHVFPAFPPSVLL